MIGARKVRYTFSSRFIEEKIYLIQLNTWKQLRKKKYMEAVRNANRLWTSAYSGPWASVSKDDMHF